MIKSFAFDIFPTSLFVAICSSFDELQEEFVFHTDNDGFVELGDKRFDSWEGSFGVTSSVINKKTLEKGFLVYIPEEISDITKLVSTISHESYHVVDKLYNFIGVQTEVDTEINAYILGWVTRNIMSTYKENEEIKEK